MLICYGLGIKLDTSKGKLMVHMSEAGHTRAKHFNYVAAITEEVLLWKPVGKMFFFP